MRKWSNYVYGKEFYWSTNYILLQWQAVCLSPVLFSTTIKTNFDPLLDLSSQTWPVVLHSKCSQCLINTPVARSCVIMVSLKCSLLQVPWKYNLILYSGTTSLLPSSTQYLILEFQLVPLGPMCMDCVVIRRHIGFRALASLDYHFEARICNWLAIKVHTSPGWFQFNGCTLS